MAEVEAQAEIDYATEEERPPLGPGEIVLGSVLGFDSLGRPLVDFLNNPLPEAVPALSTLALDRSHINRQVALLFADGKFSNPVVMGLIHSPLLAILEASQTDGEADDADSALSDADAAAIDPGLAQVDGERVVIEGKKEVVLKCGEASITLTRAGKILIRGKYLLSRSSGVNRILGGSVQVN